ncbi:caspase-1-like isoform X2 [Nylanderia fulva]|uniref:caspase-1-like isoform X2 n=1 Tax=Nylanderia fulva TaxID=613905 RepID=UPI0010FB90A7|nr:caspase-1-like isoform X2 [Nylanderia fulva]
MTIEFKNNKKRNDFTDIINDDYFDDIDKTNRNDITFIVSNASVQAWLNDKESRYYKMDHSKRGVAVIFNQQAFNNSDLNIHTGIYIECLNLVRTLKSFGFKVWDCHNTTCTDIIRILEAVANMDHSESDCLVVIVLSHGIYDYLYAADTYYKADVLFNRFTAEKCSTLAGKPKLFFIQAYNYDGFNSGITSSMQKKTNDSKDAIFNIERDFLLCYSTIPDV